MPLSSVTGAQSIIKTGVCTSTTRPAAPFEGQMIYETDTDTVLVYNGAAWVSMTPNSSLDETTRTTSSTSFVTLTGAPSVTLQTGTKALITIAGMMSQGGVAGYAFIGCITSGASTIASSTTKAAGIYWGATDLGNDKTTSFTYLETGLTAGSNVFTMQVLAAGASLTIKQKSLTVVGIPQVAADEVAKFVGQSLDHFRTCSNVGVVCAYC